MLLTITFSFPVTTTLPLVFFSPWGSGLGDRGCSVADLQSRNTFSGDFVAWASICISSLKKKWDSRVLAMG